MNKILIINPYGIGDVLFTTPVAQNLRLSFPKAQIMYLANRRTAEFLKHQKGIAKVFTYERDEFVGNYPKYFRLYQSIKAEGFDTVFDFSMNSSFGFLSLAAGIKQRVGFDFRRRGRFLTHRLALTAYEGRHVIEYYLDLLRLLDIPVEDKHMRLDVPLADQQWAGQWLLQHGIHAAKHTLVAIVPGGGASWGASAANKRWPAANYALLADKIVENFDAAVILLGDSKEEELCRQVVKLANFPLHFAAGQTSVLEMAALFKQCKAAIVNDGGPLHVAVAAGGPRTLSIFGPVDPAVYGPYPPDRHITLQKQLPCQPCYRAFRKAKCSHISCLNQLSVEEVYRKVEGVL